MTNRGLTLIAASLGFAVIQLDVSVVNVAIKPIGQELGGGVSGLQWVVDAYTVTFAALILTAGALGDRIGAKRVFLAGFALFTLASAACGLAPSLAVLIASRAVQGVGAAMLAPSSLSLLNHTFSQPGERARAVGFWAAGGSVALGGGPLIGGILTATIGWRSIFFINAPIGLLGILLTVRFAEETTREPGRGVDVPGQLAGIVALAALAAATIEGGRRGFGDTAVLTGYAIAVLAGATFVLVEARGRRPMLPLRLFRSGGFGASAAIGLLINIAFYGLIFVLSLFFQRGQGLSSLQTGLAFAPITVAVLISNVLAGRLDARFGPRRVIMVGAALMVLGAATLLGVTTATSYGAIAVQLVVMGCGLGLIVPAMTAAILGSVEQSWSGIASGTLNTARQTGSVIGVALFGALISGGSDLNSGLRVTLAICVGLAAIVLVVARKVPAESSS